MIIYISDFDLGGSGYSNIGQQLCQELVFRHDLGVIALGLGYNGQEHSYPFSIVPVPHLSHVPHMVKRLVDYGAPIEAIVVALDIIQQEAMIKALNIPSKIPYLALFPLESGPLCQPWAINLMRANGCLVMSEFAVKDVALAGLEADFIPLGVGDIWRPPTVEEKVTIRQGLGMSPNTFNILTVADNQERKNLDAAAKMVAGLSIKPLSYAPNGFVLKKEVVRDVSWTLVTRLDSPVGWKLDDLFMRYGIMDRVAIYNRGMPVDKLWLLYAAADCFLLTSKAEGLALPLLEAMACRVTTVGTNHAAIAEHLDDRLGYLIEPEYGHIDPFGNGWRVWASAEDGIRKLTWLYEQGPDETMLDRAQAYIRARTWEKAGQVLVEAIRKVKNGNT